jgi:hypothetical protein
MVGVTLARSGLGLVTGNAPGVDLWVSRAFCATLRSSGLDERGRFCQISSGYLTRGSLFPVPGFRSAPESRIEVDSLDAWTEEALARSDAAIMVGGHRGALMIARRFIDNGKPVFPIPFTGGRSDNVFQELLRTWNDNPVPGLTRNQFVSLALPWVTGTGSLQNLLLGVLADSPDIFLSYRRTDVPAAAGRLHRDLSEHFGTKRVFMDVHGIAPCQIWDRTIESAIERCKVGVVVIGNRWMPAPSTDTPARSNDRTDFVRHEVATLLKAGKPVAPVLIDGARLPDGPELPEELLPLLNFQAPALNNANWDAVVAQLIGELERAIGAQASTEGSGTS